MIELGDSAFSEEGKGSPMNEHETKQGLQSCSVITKSKPFPENNSQQQVHAAFSSLVFLILLTARVYCSDSGCWCALLSAGYLFLQSPAPDALKKAVGLSWK